MVQQVPTRFLQFEVSCCSPRQHAAQHSRLSPGAGSCRLAASSWRWRLVGKHQGVTSQLQLHKNFRFYSRVTWTCVLYKAVVTAPAGDVNCQLPKSNQQINGMLLYQKAVTLLYQEYCFWVAIALYRVLAVCCPCSKNVYLTLLFSDSLLNLTE